MRLHLVLLMLLYSAVAHADEVAPRVLLWGFQRGAEALPDLDRHVQRELLASGFPGVERLDPGQSIRMCQGAVAGIQVRRACPQVSQGVRILGGRIESLKPPQNRARLWVYDTSTGRTAWLDTYCQSCMQANLLSRNAVALLNNPDGSTAAGPVPSYCSPATGNEAAVGRPPEEACAPWPEFACEEPATQKSSALAGAAPGGIDPKLAKFVQGSIWGLFAATTATSIALFAANETTAGTVTSAEAGGRYTLTRPAWAMASVAAVTLALAIPTTILVQRAQRTSDVSSSPSIPPSVSPISCPK